jgi:ankyrin repeat protein
VIGITDTAVVQGSTPLIHASCCDNMPVIEAILKAGTDVNAADEDVGTVVHETLI